ncbi:MAG: hypothetical protein LBT38_05970 [Deltaproteobacteria bacterium]|nr:hypothetical protein [Deltaproteobacteria bacterium]
MTMLEQFMQPLYGMAEAEGEAKGLAKGLAEASRKIAKELLLKGTMTDEEIAVITSLDLETVKEIKSNINNQ